jgi:hypothetical protein
MSELKRWFAEATVNIKDQKLEAEGGEYADDVCANTYLSTTGTRIDEDINIASAQWDDSTRLTPSI